MKARVQEMRAPVVESEAEVPKALAQALKEGKMGVMDYYSLRNLLADTGMREAISRSSDPAHQSEGDDAGKTR